MLQSRKRVALFAALLAGWLATPACAQESRVHELNVQVGQLAREGKYAEAVPFATEAIKAAEATFGQDDAQVAVTLNNLAQLYDELGRYAEGEPLYLRAIKINEKALGPNHPDLATELDNLAVLYMNQGRYPEAEPLYKRALSIDEKALGADNPGVATDLNNLALLYDDEGRYVEAEPLFQRAQRIDEKALGEDNPDLATDLSNLASLYYHQGRYAEAAPLFRRVLQIQEKALGPDHPSVADDLTNLAVLSKNQGGYAVAEPLFLRALSIDEKALGPEHPVVATELNNLAELYMDQNRYADAEPLFERALHIRETSLGPDHPDVATSLINLASLYLEEGKYADAEPLYQRALSINEKALGPDHPIVATTLNNLAALYMRQNRVADAEPLYQRALRIDEKALGPDHPDLAPKFANLADVYENEGRIAEAEPLYQRVFENIFQQFENNFSYMTEKERLEFLDTVASYFPTYFSFVHRYREKDPELIGSMYNLLLWEKGFVAGSVADMRRMVETSGDAEAVKLLGELTAKRTELAALLDVTPKDREQWLKQVDELKTEADETEKALVARSRVFADRKQLERATWRQVRDALRPGEAAVEFAHFNYYDKKWTGASYYAALVVTRASRDQPEYIFLGDDKQIEGEALTRFQQSVQARGLSLEPEARLPSKDAYGLIWKPLEKALTGKTRIYLSSDGMLNEIPLGIIPTPNGRLLMERYDLRLVSSTKDILRSAAPRATAAALLIGDPDFAQSEEQQMTAMRKLALPQKEETVQRAAVREESRSRDQGNGSTLPRLPGTGAEVNAIAELMKANSWKTDVYTNELALKTVVERAGSPRVVHLATHGFFLPDQQVKMDRETDRETDRAGSGEDRGSGIEDPMLRSGLYFAGANRTLQGKSAGEGLDNGVLTAMEAGSLDLRGTELVVLSACNTGQGDVKNGEGVFGLRRALEEAGAQSVLMSLWSVPDRETLELMQDFYKKWLAGMEIHEALKEAQLEVREEVRKSHAGKDLPYYWGAFVLVGR